MGLLSNIPDFGLQVIKGVEPYLQAASPAVTGDSGAAVGARSVPNCSSIRHSWTDHLDRYKKLGSSVPIIADWPQTSEPPLNRRPIQASIDPSKA